MWRYRLAGAVLAMMALGVPMAGFAQATTLSGQRVTIDRAIRNAVQYRQYRTFSFNPRAAMYARTLEGLPYAYGGTSRYGFDCSGLTQYVYRHLGKSIQRTAQAQFLEFRRIRKARAWGGDLVFFHVSSDPSSYVYHVGVYEGGNAMVAATDYGGGVQWQVFTWAGDTVTFGTLTH